MNQFSLVQDHSFDIVRATPEGPDKPREMSQKSKLRGHFKVEITRKDGTIENFEFDNDIVNVGKNMILNVMFNSATASATWYVGLISNTAFSALAAADAMNSHAGWAESAVYSGGVRPTWTVGSASGQAVTNSSPVVFNITSSDTLYGIFICDNNTISGTSGNLWATAAFASTVPVNNGDQVKITYTISS